MKKRILFTVQHSAQFKAPLLLINVLKKSDEFEPIIFFTKEHGYHFEQEKQYCRAAGIEILDVQDYTAKGSMRSDSSLGLKSKPIIRSKGWKQLLLEKSPAIIRHIIYLSRLKKKIKKIVLENTFSILIVPEDALPIHSVFVYYARLKGIPAITIPFTFSNESEIVIVYPTRPLVILLDKIFCMIFPKWKLSVMGSKIVWGSLSEALTLELLRLAPYTPWCLMGGRTDTMIVENQYSKEFYVKAGVQKNKMLQLGAVYQDVFFQKLQNVIEKKRSFINRYQLNEKPIILCSLFPIVKPLTSKFELYFPEQVIKLYDLKLETRFDTIGDLLDFHISTLTKNKNFQVLIHPHPRMNLNYIAHLPEKYGTKILDCDISEALPFCDIFACELSATARMAMTLGKPIICSPYGMHFTDYDQFKGFLKVNSKEEFVATYDALTNDTNYFTEVKKHQEEAMTLFGPIDGKATERILNYLSTLVN